jgi:hypothetical protein
MELGPDNKGILNSRKRREFEQKAAKEAKVGILEYELASAASVFLAILVDLDQNEAKPAGFLL